MITSSIIKRSQLEGALRLDAEYYQPEYLQSKNSLVESNTVLLKDVAIITTGPAYSSEAMGEGFDLPMARIGDVVNKVEISSWFKLSVKEFNKFHNKKIKNRDILLSMTGDPPDVGKCNLITIQNDEILAFNQRVAKVTAKINSYYLFAYLSTDIARLQAERNALGIRQRNLGINDLRNTLVFMPDENEQEFISNLVEKYLSEIKSSQSLYFQAENLLLEELGLKDFENENNLFNVVNLSEAKNANRIDAEYFQLDFKRLIKKVKTQKLGDLAKIQKGIEPGSDTYQDNGKLFIRVSSLTKDGVIDKDQKYLSDTLYDKLKEGFEPQVGEILLTKDATPGIAYVLKEPIKGIISGGVLRLISQKGVNAEYLAFCVNSIIGKSQIERDSGGSIIKHWRPEQVKNLQIPILPKPTQQKIADLVKKSHEARRRAKELLEEAKQRVEQLIENS